MRRLNHVLIFSFVAMFALLPQFAFAVRKSSGGTVAGKEFLTGQPQGGGGYVPKPQKVPPVNQPPEIRPQRQ
jgi:hypothetical protein